MTETRTNADQQTTETAAWMRLARAAGITMVVWAILVHVSARTVIPPVILVGVAFLVFAPLLSGERRKLGLGYALVSALAVGGNAPIIIDELIRVDSTPSFVLNLLSVVGSVTAIVAGLGAFFRWSSRVIRPVAVTAAVVFGVGALTSVVMFATTDNAPALAGDVAVVAEKIAYVPGDITVAKGSTGIWIENMDGIRHTFTVQDIGVDLEIPALKTARVDIDADPGSYTYICTVPGHESMTGTLTIEG